MGLHEAAQRAAEAVRAGPKRWFLACDSDADGVCAAAVTAAALHRAGYSYQVRASRDKTEEAYRELVELDAGLILLDKGTSHMALWAKRAAAGRTVILLDHHNLPDPLPAAPGLVLVNPRAEGLDGSRDASSATVALAFALALGGARNLDLAPVALSGAIGDWQHVPAWQGWNLDIVEQAMAAGHIRREAVPNLIGATLAAALSHPGVPGLGDEAACAAFLTRLGLDPDAEAEELSTQERTRLVSAIALKHLGAGQAGAVDELVRHTLWNIRLGTSLRHVYRIVDACGRANRAALGLAYLLGDPAGTADAKAEFARYKQHLHAGLKALAAHGAEPRSACRVHWTEMPAFTGMVAGLGVEHVLPHAKPLVVLAPRDDGAIQVSTRGTHAHVEAGMDLGAAVQAAARSVEAEGGGHPVAAGAVVDHERIEAFLAALDAALVEQGFLPQG
jgi:single-stranded-DNA-specific exonuclease